MRARVRNRLDHLASVLVSTVLNGLLLWAFLIYMTPRRDTSIPETVFFMLDPVEEIRVEEAERFLQEELPELETLADLPFLDDMPMDIAMDLDFPATEALDAPVEAANLSQLTELLSDISSPILMSGLMPGRTALARQEALSRWGGAYVDETEMAVNRALHWLASVQQDSGGWNRDGSARGGGNRNVGYTGLALLTFLSNGQTPGSAEFGHNVSRAIRFLVESQDGSGIMGAGRYETYAHAIATYALAEAYSMTGNVLLREPLRMAVDVLVRYQLPDGGFRGPGSYRFHREGVSDNSVTAWTIQGMKAARIAGMAQGVDFPGLDHALQRAMDAMLAISTVRNGEFHFGYTPQNAARLNSVITEAGALALFLTGRGNTREARNVMGHIHQHVPQWGTVHKESFGGAINLWYYAIQALFHQDPDGRAFQRYQRAMARALIDNQAPEGFWLSFDRGAAQGPVFNTTLAAKGLMVPYRHLPTTQVERMQETFGHGHPAAGSFEDEDLIRILL